MMRGDYDPSLTELAGFAGFAPAAHHRRLIDELERLSGGGNDRLMVLMPPGHAKSTYATLNLLLGSLSAMASAVVSYWVGSSAGSARKEASLASIASKAGGG